jgi:hypothetical protein
MWVGSVKKIHKSSKVLIKLISRHYDKVCELKRANHLRLSKEKGQNPERDKNRIDSQLYTGSFEFRNGQGQSTKITERGTQNGGRRS